MKRVPRVGDFVRCLGRSGGWETGTIARLHRRSWVAEIELTDGIRDWVAIEDLLVVQLVGQT